MLCYFKYGKVFIVFRKLLTLFSLMFILHITNWLYVKSEGRIMPDVYRALGDSTRRRILSMLKQGNKSQKEIVEAFDISQPAIKKHLNILLEEGIISESLSGKYRIYSLNLNGLQIAYHEMLQYIGELLDDQLVSLKDYVEKGEFRDEDD